MPLITLRGSLNGFSAIRAINAPKAAAIKGVKEATLPPDYFALYLQEIPRFARNDKVFLCEHRGAA